MIEHQDCECGELLAIIYNPCHFQHHGPCGLQSNDGTYPDYRKNERVHNKYITWGRLIGFQSSPWLLVLNDNETSPVVFCLFAIGFLSWSCQDWSFTYFKTRPSASSLASLSFSFHFFLLRPVFSFSCGFGRRSPGRHQAMAGPKLRPHLPWTPVPSKMSLCVFLFAYGVDRHILSMPMTPFLKS